jgi:phosphate transport system permease protein
MTVTAPGDQLDIMAPSDDHDGHGGHDHDQDVPRTIVAGLTTADHVFRGTVRGISIFVLLIMVAIGLFLGYQMFPTLHHYGWSFITEQQWLPNVDKIGIAAVVVGTVEVALIAMIVAFPISVLTALYISEYSPKRLRSTLVSLVDLLAAVPSVIYGLWGALLLQPQIYPVSRWLSQNLGWFPLFKVNTDPDAPSYAKAQYTSSAFIAGIVVAIMIVPLATAVMRGVFASAPIGEREAAYALGGARWGMVRAVVLPFGRAGIVGGTMLALGRALGETVAVLLIISPAYDIKIKILTQGSNTISALIASLFGEATSRQLSALLAAGFVLFLMTLLVNTVAALIVNRSRSGADV